ncbi:MAG: tetratricopeptide repeat protein [Labilithrix sp.]
MDRAELEKLDRESLVQRAQALGLKRARVLTRPELIDELLRRNPQVEPSQMKRTRGFFGLARDLLSRVVERGLHLPDAAERFRQALSEPVPQVPRPEPQAIPTVTLAEIYASQGHKQRAIETLRRVLEEEPDHGAARALLEKLEGDDYVPPREPLPPEPEYEPPVEEEEEEEEEEELAEDAPEEEDEEAEEIDEEQAIETPRIETPRVVPEPRVVEVRVPLRRVAIPREEPAEEAVLSVPEPLTVALPAAAIADPMDDRETDRCIALGSYVWWQLSAASQKLADESFFFLRVVTIEPTWDGPRISSRDIAADPSAGELLLGQLPARAVVRIAIGFMPEGEFVPVAHSPALELGPGSTVTQWTADAATPNVVGDPLVVAAAQRAADL